MRVRMEMENRGVIAEVNIEVPDEGEAVEVHNTQGDVVLREEFPDRSSMADDVTRNARTALMIAAFGPEELR